MGLVFGWLVLSLLAGLLGAERKIGFVAAFFLALLLSPIVGLIAAALSKSKSAMRYEAQLLATQREQAELLKNLQPVSATDSGASPASLPADPEARAARLKDLRDRGMLTQEEFMEQIGRL